MLPLQVWSSSKELLMRKLGAQTGAALWQHAHGIDHRQVEPPKARRSVGADINWGVRFDSDADADKFLRVRDVTSVCFGCCCCYMLKHLQLNLCQVSPEQPASELGCGSSTMKHIELSLQYQC
jgi:DNA repair protein REV1